MLLIDGYNVLFAHQPDCARVGPSDRSRDELVGFVDRYCAATRQKARIYFDPGRGSGGSGLRRKYAQGRVEVIHLEAGATADDAIRFAVASEPDRTAYRVVTTDREIVNAVRKRRFETITSEEFLLEAARAEAGPAPEPGRKRDGISAAEADHWMKVFGIDERKGDEAGGRP